MKHEHEIDSLKRIETLVPANDLLAKFKIYNELFKAYRSYQSDSARIYVDKELALSNKIGNPEITTIAKYDNIFTYMSKGDFTNAVNVLNNISFDNVSDSLKAEMYVLASRLYSDLSNFTSDRYEDDYAKMARTYADSAYHMAAPDSYASQLATFFLHGYKQNRKERIALFTRIVERGDLSPSMKAMVYSMLGDLYLSDNQTEKGLIYKAESAIFDIKSATRETTSKHFLAYELFGRGDVGRAAKYVHVAFEDAESYNAPQRKAEIGRAMSLIEATRYTSIKDERDNLWIILTITVIFVVVTVILFFSIRHKNHLLKKSSEIISIQNEEIKKRNLEISGQNADIKKKNDEISRQNSEITEVNLQLRQLNTRLRESIKIKDEYLGYVFYIISEYIKKIESMYKVINVKLTTKQPYDLSKMFPVSHVKIEKEKMLKEFDKIFLSLFPTFIEQYNQLFDEASNSTEPADGIMTPEMRIFALIRLGITDTEKIAQFLNYSVNTINTYKTKAKKRSIVSNDEFETKIMQIRSVK
ncbi:MAG: DUF6377 domain-containing protein [Bacteroides sp.]|nr:DUF6377 domain-containing protein [Bacteroides sp.]